MNITNERAEVIVKNLLVKFNKVFKQEIEGENEEFLPRVIRQYRAKVARHSWKSAQQWCKWDKEGPVLMPNHTRIYYRKGSTEVVLQEFPPQNRLMSFKGRLANRNNSESPIVDGDSTSHFSLALPYVIFIFKFVNGTFVDVRCAFSDRPLKRLDEKPLRPYLSNIDTNLSVCLGTYFDRSKLEKDQLSQQMAFVLDHFWHSTYSDEWSGHFWANKSNFQNCDPRMAGLQSWQEASSENPLFVIEDVDWIPHQEESFGDMIVRMFDNDKENNEFENELYDMLTETFLEEFKKSFSENINNICSGESIEQYISKWSEDLLTELSE